MKAQNLKRTMFIAGAVIISSATYLNADPVVITTQKDSSTPVNAIANAVDKGVEASVNAVKKTTHAVKEALTPEEEHKVIIKNHARHGYLNGYKGYRYARPNYVKYVDGWYYPEEAYNSKAIIEHSSDEVRTTIVHQVKLPKAHIAYCASHYRSYRRADNSFQPYSGQRQQCYSRFYRG